MIAASSSPNRRTLIPPAAVLAREDSRRGEEREDLSSAGTILVVDDEPKLRELIRLYLECDGYSVVEADSGQAALAIVARDVFDLVILDLGLPDVPGEDVLRVLAREEVPVVILTARATEPDRVAGLRAGADDYLVKPFSPRELVARVKAVLRRSNKSWQESTLRSYGDGVLTVDDDRREAVAGGETVALTRSEFDLLAVLASRPGRVWSRSELLERLQGNGFEAYERTVDAHVKNLRRKLGDDPRSPVFVITVTGVGYKLGVERDA